MSTKPSPKKKATSTPPGAPLRASAKVRFAAELGVTEPARAHAPRAKTP
jgi:hypothetical protein